MAPSLTRLLVESHLADGSGRLRAPLHAPLGAPLAGAEVALRVDQALMDADAATLVFMALATLGCARVAIDPALACAEAPPPVPAFEAGDALRYAQAEAWRTGVQFSRPGGGRAHHRHAARAAAPHRTLLACAAHAAAAGAVGGLAFEVSETELAAALTGAPHPTRLPPLWGVRLAGTLPPRLDAHDLVRALATRLPAQGLGGARLEYAGSGVASLPIEARLIIAREGARLGASGSLFPADEETRRWLRAHGREPDWKSLTGEPEEDATRVVELHLDALEPMLGRGEGDQVLPLREAAATRVGRVVLGVDAGLDELRTLAAALRGRSVAPGVELAVIPGSRWIHDRARAHGALAELKAAGARVLDAECRLAPAAPAGAALLCGASPRAAGGARTFFRAGAAALAAAALAGAIADPRDLPAAAPAPEPDQGAAPDDALIVKPAGPGTAGEDRERGPGPLPLSPPLVATLRGVVLARLGDAVATEVILPAGPMVRRHHTDFVALAGHVLAGVDRGFAARARAHRGGFLVAGLGFGCGARAPRAVFALVELGVRAVIARGFDADFRAELVRQGVLALRAAAATDLDGVRAGDELEIPGLPDVLEPNRPLAIRNLTRGSQAIVRHDLAAAEIAMVRAGGRLRGLRPVGAEA